MPRAVDSIAIIALIFGVGYAISKAVAKNQKLKLNFASVFNDGGERIETLEFTVPVLRCGVLDYKAGELQSNNPEISGRAIKLYYPPEEVSKKSFLDTIKKAPISIGTHELNTSEFNLDISGWCTAVEYSEKQDAAVADGIVKGEQNAAYIRRYARTADFGASGFIDVGRIELKSGTTPQGEVYDAIAHDLSCTHVALLPNVRDPENKITTHNARVMIFNSVSLKNEMPSPKGDESEEAFIGKFMTDKKMQSEFPDEKQRTAVAYKKWSGKNSIKNGVTKMAEEKEAPAIDKNALRNVLDEIKNEDAASTKLAELEKTVNALSAKMAESEKGKSENAEESEEAKNADEEKNGEGKNGEGKDEEIINAKNAKPTQETIKLLGEHYGIDFGRTTPTFNALASLLGASDKSFIEKIGVVNAKAKELKISKSGSVATAASATSFDSFLAGVK